MALQLATATFVASYGPVAVTFPAPLSPTYGIVGYALTLSDAPLGVIPAIGFDAIVPGSPNCSVNVYASDAFTGSVVFTISDLP